MNFFKTRSDEEALIDQEFNFTNVINEDLHMYTHASNLYYQDPKTIPTQEQTDDFFLDKEKLEIENCISILSTGSNSQSLHEDIDCVQSSLTLH